MPELETLFTADVIKNRVAEMARDIEVRFEGATVVLIGVLKGSIHFLSDLSRELRLDNEIDFLQASSYGLGKLSSGVVQIRKDLDIDIAGKHVIIVEDIVDTGVTLSYLRELLSARDPKSLSIAALLSKTKARRVEISVNFVGFEIPNEFVVGYGLDFAEKYRNLPFVAILR